MSAELPQGIAIEQVWAVEGRYAADALERRAPVRATHLARTASLIASGQVLEAGAFGDASGSLFLVRADDEEAALALFRDDVYVEAGVWTDLRARPFGRVVLTAGTSRG